MPQVTFNDDRTLDIELEGGRLVITENGEFRGAVRIGEFDEASSAVVKTFGELPVVDADPDPDDDLEAE